MFKRRQKAELAEWILKKWDSEVKSIPLSNVYRRVLDTTWRQIYTKITGSELPRPKHDDEVATIALKEERMDEAVINLHPNRHG